MNILITGASGFLGFNLAKALLNQGHKITNLSRNECQKLNDIGIQTIKCNLNNLEEVTSALKKIEVVFHVASLVGMHGDYNQYFQTNVIGTENIVKACIKNGVSKLIYTSSPSVVFGKDDLCNVDETQNYPKKFLTHYAKTKSLAEQIIKKANSKKLLTVSLRPHLIFGPDDPHLIPRLIQSANSGKLRQIGDGQNLVDIIYIDNAVDAHIQALENLSKNSKLAGNVYFIGQERPVNLWNFINKILENNGISKIENKISCKEAYFIGFILEKVFSILKKEPPMTRFIALQFSKSHYFSHKNARDDFGYIPKINIEDAIKRTSNSFKEKQC